MSTNSLCERFAWYIATGYEPKDRGRVYSFIHTLILILEFASSIREHDDAFLAKVIALDLFGLGVFLLGVSELSLVLLFDALRKLNCVSPRLSSLFL